MFAQQHLAFMNGANTVIAGPYAKTINHIVRHSDYSVQRILRNPQLQLEQVEGIDPATVVDDIPSLFSDSTADCFIWAKEILDTPKLVSQWHECVRVALLNGYRVYNMARSLRIADDNALVQIATQNGVQYLDTTQSNPFEGVTYYEQSRKEARRICIVGTGMRSGKFTAQVKIRSLLSSQHFSTEPSGLLCGAEAMLVHQSAKLFDVCPAIDGHIMTIEKQHRQPWTIIGAQTGSTVRKVSRFGGHAGGIASIAVIAACDPDFLVVATQPTTFSVLEREIGLLSYLCNAKIAFIVVNSSVATEEQVNAFKLDTEQRFQLPCLDVLTDEDRLNEVLNRLK